MRLFAIVGVLAFSGCLSANATSPDAADEPSEEDALESLGPTVYYMSWRVETAWSGVAATTPGTTLVLEEYPRVIEAEGGVVNVSAKVEWDSAAVGTLKACVVRDAEAIAEIPCVEGSSPLEIGWADEASPLLAGDYSLVIEASTAGAPAGVFAASMVTGELEVTSKMVTDLV